MPDQPNNTPEGAQVTVPSRTGRPIELEDFLNARIFHPLAWELALALRKTIATPNQVSVIGGLVVILAATLYAMADSLLLTALAFALHLSWHVLDGADGDLARMTGRASRRGEIIDGISDYLSHIILYVMLGSLLASQIGPAGWFWAVAAGAARIAQAIFYENQRRQYQFWVYDLEWLRISSKRPKAQSSWIERIGDAYARLGAWLTPLGTQVDNLLIEAEKIEKNSLRRLIKSEYAYVLRHITPLNANYRTVVIGLSMLTGSPLYAFAFESIVLSAWLLSSIVIARKKCWQIIAQARLSISR